MIGLIWCLLQWSALFYGLMSIVRWRHQQKALNSEMRRNENKVQGKIVVITGASSGTGQAAALEFASRDATVILACRNLSKAEETVHWIRGHTLLGELVCMKLDLASLKSVREFAKEFKSKYDKLDILINNAGVSFPIESKQKTEDGFEVHVGVNHLGHFLLTNLLLEPLKKASPSRIVTVSSEAHSWNEFNVRDMFSEKDKVQPKSVPVANYLYARSKKANALFSKELARRLEGVNTYCLCPGGVYTNLGENQTGMIKTLLTIFDPILRYISKTPAEGAATIMYCALNKGLSNETGGMYKDCRHWDQSKRCVLIDNDAKTLWEASAKYVGSLN